MSSPEWLSLPDLALRPLGGAVVWANDELFAEKENLIKPGPASYQPATFGHKGQVYDGWETRRRRGVAPDDRDVAIVRLGVPGVVRGVVVDTAWFTGNYPSYVAVDGIAVDGYPGGEELAAMDGWEPLLERSPARGDTPNTYEVNASRRVTHVRLSMFPDGGIARFRVHGEGVADPVWVAMGSIDLAALENGALVTGCSNMFYSSPQNLLFPGVARVMGDGWETARRRDDGNDWVQVRLAGEGVVRMAEVDTSCFLGNSPGEVSIRGRVDDGEWFDVLARRSLRPDTRHRFVVDGIAPATDVRVDIYPDGGFGRLRLYGDLTDRGLEFALRRWHEGA